MSDQFRYSTEPEDPQAFTAEFDRFYTQLARLYDWAIKVFPIWRRWIFHVLPHVEGPRVLEISFGTGYLLDRYPGELEVFALEYNQQMITAARAAITAIANKDEEALFNAGNDQLYPPCESCHQRYMAQ